MLREIWTKLRHGSDARLREVVTEAIAECYDSRRQAERLQRWEQRLNQWSARDLSRAGKSR